MDTTTSSLLLDFLSFRVLMSPAVLVLLYYAGAVMAPVLVFWFYKKSVSKIDQSPMASHKAKLKAAFDKSETVQRHKQKAIVLAIMTFLMMEFFWRMMFEFFVAYYQMHNALIKIAG